MPEGEDYELGRRRRRGGGEQGQQPESLRVVETGDSRVTEAGDTRITEET